MIINDLDHEIRMALEGRNINSDGVDPQRGALFILNKMINAVENGYPVDEQDMSDLHAFLSDLN